MLSPKIVLFVSKNPLARIFKKPGLRVSYSVTAYPFYISATLIYGAWIWWWPKKLAVGKQWSWPNRVSDFEIISSRLPETFEWIMTHHSKSVCCHKIVFLKTIYSFLSMHCHAPPLLATLDPASRIARRRGSYISTFVIVMAGISLVIGFRFRWNNVQKHSQFQRRMGLVCMLQGRVLR